MKNHVKLVLMLKTTPWCVLTAVILMTALSASGQTHRDSLMLKQMEKSEKEYAARSANEKKLQSALYEIFRDAEAADTSLTVREKFRDELTNPYLKTDSKDRIRIVVEINSAPAVKEVAALIKSLDGVIEGSSEYSRWIICKIHPKKIRTLIASPSVKIIRIPAGPVTKNIVSAGDVQLKADSARLQFMTYGEGVKIGVISDGVYKEKFSDIIRLTY